MSFGENLQFYRKPCLGRDEAQSVYPKASKDRALLHGGRERTCCGEIQRQDRDRDREHPALPMAGFRRANTTSKSIIVEMILRQSSQKTAPRTRRTG